MNDATPLRAPLWSGLGLIGPLEARLVGPLPAGIGGISIDTRTLQPGDLFFAIRGEEKDAHDFVAQAFAKGAAAAVVEERRAAEFGDEHPLFVVHRALASLERLGQAARARAKAKILAVTGSVGKTSTKDALRLVLGEQGETHAATASFNNHIGVPLTLARLPAAARFGVFEIGMNHAGEITPLTLMVRPHVAVITTVGAVHIEYLGSIEAVADAKAEIFAGLEPGGTAIIHRDIAEFDRLRGKAEASAAGSVLSFGEHQDADARLVSADVGADHSDVVATIHGRVVRYRLGAPGRHMVANSLAVLLAAVASGADLDAAMATLSRLTPPQGRGERSRLVAPTGAFVLIDESYNANPMSMRAALTLLAQTPPGGGGRRIAVLGDMLELGPEAGDLHADLAKAVAESKADVVFAAGPLMRGLIDAVPNEKRGAWAERAADIEAAVLDTVHAGDVVMVKGSKGSRTSTIVAALKQRFAAPPVAGRP